MQTTNRKKLIDGFLVTVLVVVVVCWFLNNLQPAKPPPSAPGYYMGPLRSKGNPNMAATEDGRKVDLPPLAPSKPEGSKKEVLSQNKKDGPPDP
jgi:hypothetical protein